MYFPNAAHAIKKQMIICVSGKRKIPSNIKGCNECDFVAWLKHATFQNTGLLTFGWSDNSITKSVTIEQTHGTFKHFLLVCLEHLRNCIEKEHRRCQQLVHYRIGGHSLNKQVHDNHEVDRQQNASTAAVILYFPNRYCYSNDKSLHLVENLIDDWSGLQLGGANNYVPARHCWRAETHNPMSFSNTTTRKNCKGIRCNYTTQTPLIIKTWKRAHIELKVHNIVLLEKKKPSLSPNDGSTYKTVSRQNAGRQSVSPPAQGSKIGLSNAHKCRLRTEFLLFLLVLCALFTVQAAQDVDLRNLSPSTGFRITGAANDDQCCYSVSAAGDVNGDGIGDVIVGAPFADHLTRGDAGTSCVIFGRDIPNGAAALADVTLPIPPATLPDDIGFCILGTAAGDRSGLSVSAAGDVNGDGIDDLIVGSYLAETPSFSNAGITYVIFGRDLSLSSADPFGNYQLPSLAMPDNDGFRLLGSENSAYTGVSVSAAGDVNGDGIGDIIIGANSADTATMLDAGIAYVVFGRNLSVVGVSPFGDIELTAFSTAMPPAVGFRVVGSADYDRCGESVSAAGDVNHDGIGDIIIGAPYADANGISSSGISYVIFGRNLSAPGATPFGDILLTDLEMEVGIGFRILGVLPNDYNGFSVSAAGDVNNDNIDDIIVGAYGADPPGKNQAGISYVLFGRDLNAPGVFPFGDIQLTTGNIEMLSSVGFRILGATAGGNSGFSVSAAGDVNGDGIADVIIGDYGTYFGVRYNAGISYVIFGRDIPGGETALSDIQLQTSALDPSIGYRILGEYGGDNSGYSVSTAGDINNDGVGDVVISAPFSDTPSSSDSGQVYVVFGIPPQPTSQPSSQPTRQPSRQPSVKPSRQPSGQPTDAPSVQPKAQPTSQPSKQPSTQPSEQPFSQPTSYPSVQPTSQPSRQPTEQPACVPSMQPSTQPSDQPSAQPIGAPSSTPSTQPTSQPSCQPYEAPSSQPSMQPTNVPSTQLSQQPTVQPSSQPSTQPFVQPSRQPSHQPSSMPSAQPTMLPTLQPTTQPTIQPTDQPSCEPSRQPSEQPSSLPSTQPSAAPSVQPSDQPSSQPSIQPTALPSSQPTILPSVQPSVEPSMQPSSQPSNAPSVQPSSQPSVQPSCRPSTQPTSVPSVQPSEQPYSIPSTQPSATPSSQPTSSPSGRPSCQPSSQPSGPPSCQPTAFPSSVPSAQPSTQPTQQPVCSPTSQPSVSPTVMPSLTVITGEWYSHINDSIKPSTLTYVDGIIWTCGVLNNTNGTSYCSRFDSIYGKQLALFSLHWVDVTSFLLLDDASRIWLSGRAVSDGSISADITNCAVSDAQLTCSVHSLADTQLSVSSYIPIMKKFIFIGSYYGETSITLLSTG